MRQKMLRSKTLTGIVLAVAAGCFWGTMAVSGQYMITACGFNAGMVRKRHSKLAAIIPTTSSVGQRR